MASNNSFHALNPDEPAPDSSIVPGTTAVPPAASPALPSTQSASGSDVTNALGLAGLEAAPPTSTATTADKGIGKRTRASEGTGSGEEDDHQARQHARRTDLTNPFRVGDPLNPHAARYRDMCEQRHIEQTTENGHAAAAMQIAYDNGFHPDRTPFVAQPDDGETDAAFVDILHGAEGIDVGSPPTEAVRLQSQRLARAATVPRRSASAIHDTAPVAEAGPAPAVDAFDVDAMDEDDGAAPPALPPPLGKSRAKAPTKSSKSGITDDALTSQEKEDIIKIHEVFRDSTILLKVAPSSYDIDGRGPQWALANVSRQQAADWGHYDDPHFLIVVPGPPMNDELRAATAAALQAIIESATPSESKKKQAQVASANAQDPSLPLLNVFLAFGFTAAVRDGFRVSTGFCAGRDNQLIFTFDLDNHASPFLYTLFGLTLDEPEDADQVADLVSTALSRDENVRKLVIKVKPSLSPTLRQKPDTDLVDYFLDSVRVTSMRMVSPSKRGVWITQWNVYMDHAHLFQSQHRALRTTVASIPIVTSFFGTGRMIKKHWYCATCMSISHPTGLCPFAALPGWAVTLAAAADPPNDIASRLGEAAEGNSGGRGGFRGGRGGGRGGRGFHGGRGGRGGKF